MLKRKSNCLTIAQFFGMKNKTTKKWRNCISDHLLQILVLFRFLLRQTIIALICERLYFLLLHSCFCYNYYIWKNAKSTHIDPRHKVFLEFSSTIDFFKIQSRRCGLINTVLDRKVKTCSRNMGQKSSCMMRRNSKVETRVESNVNCAIILPSPRDSNNVLQKVIESRESQHENPIAKMKNDNNIRDFNAQFQLVSQSHFVATPISTVSIAITAIIETIEVGVQTDKFDEHNSSFILDSGYESSLHNHISTLNPDKDVNKSESLAEFEMLEILIEDNLRRRLHKGKWKDSRFSSIFNLYLIQPSSRTNDLLLLSDELSLIAPAASTQNSIVNVHSVYNFWIPLKEMLAFTWRGDRGIELSGRRSSCIFRSKNPYSSPQLELGLQQTKALKWENTWECNKKSFRSFRSIPVERCRDS